MTPAVATRTAVEVLRFLPENQRAIEMFAALERTAASHGIAWRSSSLYSGETPWLMLWGPGGLNRLAPMRRQIKAGGHCIVWDLAYWERDRKVRVSIDAAHPQAWVMRKDWPATRLNADRLTIGNVWNPDGPVILAGLGDKARVQYGAGVVDAWEAAMRAEATRRGRTVIYRPKLRQQPTPIDQALRGASLVITWHSNVAVDAIRVGVPVICRDGAAAAVCPSEFGSEYPQPLEPAIRDTFLANLAWFQWAPSEAVQCWAFLRDLLPC